ncbi:MAG: zinc ribbon domain-containing protein [Treponema sp.]|nr:zinc ribbon domain-containing protein [Treponema sp.]
MPTYEYECKSCGYSFETFQAMSDDPLKSCPKCGKEVRRLINGGSGVIFKGSGFYVTDKGKASAGAKAKPSKDSGGSSAGADKAPAAASAGASADKGGGNTGEKGTGGSGGKAGDKGSSGASGEKTKTSA